MKLAPSMAPSKTPGAVASHPQRGEKRTGYGAWSWTRAPRRARYRRRRLFVCRHRDQACRIPGRRGCHTTRTAATSGRSCSEGRTVFFDGHVDDRRQTGRRAERVLQLGYGAIRLLRDAARVCRCGTSGAARAAGTSPVSRRRCSAAPTRSRGQRPRPSSRHHCRAGPVLGDPSNRRIGPPALVHAEVPRRAQAVQGLSEKRFNHYGVMEWSAPPLSA